ncbi:hypothetical protein SCHPADRAFT_311942 [Schizopora paradoxa]|uniref:Uncharacterized protein n=1 Tax=Schizopora paradoxa TaxID=27342 RepID=A0A0H2SC36_9AGAM|nr:hypothetical protein SCHPADRAFT_311942 [Schizopora paradoxa]
MISVLFPASDSIDEFSNFTSSVWSDQVRDAFQTLSCAQDSLQYFQRWAAPRGGSLRLQCTIPTWCHSPIHCHDLHDLHDLRERSLMFLHELTRTLRSNGIFVTYRLTPSDSDVVVIQTIPSDGTTYPSTTCIDREIIHEIGLKRRGETLISETNEGPVLLMT